MQIYKKSSIPENESYSTSFFLITFGLSWIIIDKVLKSKI